MTLTGELLPRSVVRGGIFFALIGLVLLAYGMSLRPFTNEGIAMQAFVGWCDDDGRVSDIAGDRFHAYETLRYPLMNAGIWLGLAGVSLALLTGVLAKSVGFRGSWARTPFYRWTYFAIGIGVVLLEWAASMIGIALDQQRFAFPACADSIVIGMMGLTVSTIALTAILIVIGLLISRGFGVLPVSLIQWDESRPGRSRIVTVIFVFAILIGTMLQVASITSANFLSAPAAVATIYLLAATRAALLAPKVAASMPR